MRLTRRRGRGEADGEGGREGRARGGGEEDEQAEEDEEEEEEEEDEVGGGEREGRGRRRQGCISSLLAQPRTIAEQSPNNPLRTKTHFPYSRRTVADTVPYEKTHTLPYSRRPVADTVPNGKAHMFSAIPYFLKVYNSFPYTRNGRRLWLFS